MPSTFDDILVAIQPHPKKRVAVAVAQDDAVLHAVARAEKENVADCVLVGDKEKIRAAADAVGADITQAEIVHEGDAHKAARTAVSMVSAGDAHIAMKGKLHTDDFLRAILDKEVGLRAGRLLSHVFILEIPPKGVTSSEQKSRLLFVTDGAMNIAPNFEEKAQICVNAIGLAKLFGIEEPKVAALAGVELVNPKMQATQDAAVLALMSYRGQFEVGMVEGPLAMDLAVSEEAARIKGVKNPVAGKAEILLMPSLEAGNILVKGFSHLAGGRTAGLVLGAKAPIVLTSRSDTAESKFLSIACAVYAADMAAVKVKIGKVRG
ncbi:MAG: bifunctional enoyl-CoA hydratase/phosphate acetyltransferase [Deltaproteobacteria bacterium]|nr:bifunctional enoyl-CoA hydratase/phosphate acetyltransferase [Deltaproteobacteria bacterium]